MHAKLMRPAQRVTLLSLPFSFKEMWFINIVHANERLNLKMRVCQLLYHLTCPPHI